MVKEENCESSVAPLCAASSPSLVVVDCENQGSPDSSSDTVPGSSRASANWLALMLIARVSVSAPAGLRAVISALYSPGADGCQVIRPVNGSTCIPAGALAISNDVGVLRAVIW